MRTKVMVALLISFLVFFITFAAYYLNLLEKPELLAYDTKMKIFRSEKAPPPSVKTILVDDNSIKALENVAGRWPWPRAIWADLLEFLSLGGARAVLFDILFTQRYDEANDRALADATAAAGVVYHSMVITHESIDKDGHAKSDAGRPMPQEFVDRFSIKQVQGRPAMRPEEENNQFELPMEMLRPAARGMTVVEFTKDNDGVFRRTRPIREYQGRYFPVLGIAPFVDERTTIEFRKGSILINDRAIPVDEKGDYLINMYGIERVEPISIGGIFASLQKIRNGELEGLIVDPAEFKDAIVFVGASAIGAADLKPTPLSPSTPGVILHVSLASNYLMNDFIVPADRRVTVASVLFGAFLTTFVVLFAKRLLVRAAFPMLLLAAYTAATFYAFRSNLLMETVPFIVAAMSSGFLSFGYLTFTEAAEKRRVSPLFSTYVSKDVLNEVLNNYKEYMKSGMGQKVELSVLFSDIRGFTTMSETSPPEKIVEMLNVHFTHMGDVILKNKGTLDKYIGDAIMAFWGAPVIDKDHAYNSVLASMEMIEALEKVNKELQERGFPAEVKIGVGINTGVATIGNIGSARKLNYTVVGDAVNLASRLESITKEYKTPIVISEHTYEQVKDRIECKLLGNVKVKGREQPVNIYAPVRKI